MTPNASPMGQVILGFRSLLVKIAVFVVMAAMLAWILGGTLWPKTAVRVVGKAVEIDGRTLVLVDQIGGPLDRATFGLATRRDGRIEDRWPRAEDMTPAWSDAMAPVAGADGGAAFAYAVAGRWSVCTVEWTVEPDDQWNIGDCVEVADRWDAARCLESYQRTGTFDRSASKDAVASDDAASD